MHELLTLRGSEWWGDNSWMSSQSPRESRVKAGKCRGQRRGGASRNLFHVCWGSNEPVDKRRHRGKGDGRRQDPDHRCSGPLSRIPPLPLQREGKTICFTGQRPKSVLSVNSLLCHPKAGDQVSTCGARHDGFAFQGPWTSL